MATRMTLTTPRCTISSRQSRARGADKPLQQDDWRQRGISGCDCRSIAAGDAPAIAFDLGEAVQFVECSLLVGQVCCTGLQKRAYWSGAGHRLLLEVLLSLA